MQEVIRILIPIGVTYVCVLVATVFIIKRLLLSDTAQAVNKIKQVETEVRKKEEAIRREIEEHEKEFAKKKADAEADLQKRKEDSEKEVGRMRDQVLSDAKKEAERLLDQAKKNEEKLRKQIAQEMEEKAVDYGIQVLKLVFSEKMNEHLNKTFIDELLDALGEVDSSSITVDASEVQFSSSHPMLPEQKERLEKLLAEKFNVNIKVNEKIQKELIAGLVFKLGSLEIDGSLSNRLQEAAAEMKKSITT
jgi:F-type H+-transporting ATPase subunit b